MKTRIEVYLESKIKKETGHPGQKPEHVQKPQYELKFNVGYDQNDIYFQLSGGSQPVFYTVNEEVANTMIPGKKYAIEISPID